LEVATANARKAAVAKRFHPIPGDALEADFGGPYDLILAANLAHHFDEVSNVKLFQKARVALKSSGRFALIEWIAPSDDAFALTVLATSARGAIYTLKGYSKMLRAAGFRKVQRLDTGDFGRWIIIALP
jgi:SAM-dependent methyltransferase